MLLKKILLSILLFFTNYINAQDVRTLDSLVKNATSSFTIKNDKPVGQGWDLLSKQFIDNNFVGWGEYHNSPLISVLAKEALEIAARNKYNVWITETGYYACKDLVNAASSNIFRQKINSFYKTYGVEGYTPIPFFRLAEDSAMLETALKHSINIWGIDQEQQSAFPYLITEVYNNLKPAVKNVNKPLYDSLMKYWYYPKKKDLDSLIKLVSSKEDVDKILEIKLSREIYGNFGEDLFLCNTQRVALMKTHFYKQLNQYEKNIRNIKKPVKMFIKMGDSHLTKGFTLTTQQLDMGNLMNELAISKGSHYSNTQFVCRYYKSKGKLHDELTDKVTNYSRYFLKMFNKNEWTVVDLRPLKGKFENDKSLDERTYEIIDKYDIIVISPEVNE